MPTTAREAFSQAFTIGLKPLADPALWLAPDEGLASALAEKTILLEANRPQVFQARDDMAAAQDEVLTLLSDHLVAAFPDVYRRQGSTISISLDGGPIVVDLEAGEPSLITASRLVSDDLVLMRKSGDGWRLAAASLCFPTHWRLSEKFDLPMTSVHAPVPGFGEGTRNAMMIERMFDNLPVGKPVVRSNWSVHTHGEFHRPDPHPQHLLAAGSDPAALARLFLRCEDQTLTRLQGSGDMLFTIRISTDPLKQLKSMPELARSLAARLRALDDAQIAYKGLQDGRDRIADWLETAIAC